MFDIMDRYMSEKKEKRTSGIRRYFIASHRTSSLHLIPFHRLIHTEHLVRIADLSVVGVGIEASELLEPGLAFFEDPVGGHKFGVITWCRKSDEGYRAGISFIMLQREQEEYILHEVRRSPSHTPLRDPDKIIEGVLNSIRPE